MSSPDNIGKVGERRVARKLDWLAKEYIVLNDIMLPTQYGTTQIDHIVVDPMAFSLSKQRTIKVGFSVMRIQKNGSRVYWERRDFGLVKRTA